MRVFLVFLVILIVLGAGGFFYLVRQANVGAPTPGEAEVSVDVDLAR